jgi:RNA-directed DNA polymerase
MAIEHVRQAIADGYGWCVSIDLKSFFDEIPHGLIFKLIRRKMRDERVLTLIARVLKAGVMVEGVFEKSSKGCPQGSPVSPILSNIVLNELDQELERRGHRYGRWADDFVILVQSERAAQRVMGGVTRYLDEVLGLAVNLEKSRVAPAKDVEFLGFQVLRGKIRISTKARKRFKDSSRDATTGSRCTTTSRTSTNIYWAGCRTTASKSSRGSSASWMPSSVAGSAPCSSRSGRSRPSSSG